MSQVSFPGKQILRSRLTCKMFSKKYPWDPYLWACGRKEMETGWGREKWICKVNLTTVSADPMGSSVVIRILQHCPNLGQHSQIFMPWHVLEISCGPPRKECVFGQGGAIAGMISEGACDSRSRLTTLSAVRVLSPSLMWHLESSSNVHALGCLCVQDYSR